MDLQRVEGELVAPAPICGLIVSAHGSASRRHSRRHQPVAQALH